uniref:Uncharacterized protein n=1 Tax=Anguilla anguilla TaxID=7936 RepID=A0A0E9R876_ANGAN
MYPFVYLEFTKREK